MEILVSSAGLAPFSLKDAPALIERVFPAQKVGIEAQKERKANVGQTLTVLGSYWKGRKPLVLVRACVLASLLPATDDPDGDLDVFEMLMRMDEEGLLKRSPSITATHVWLSSAVTTAEKLDQIEMAETTGEFEEVQEEARATDTKVKWKKIDSSPFRDPTQRRVMRDRVEAIRSNMRKRAFLAMPYFEQVSLSERVEKIEDINSPVDGLYSGIWQRVNSHLGTTASTLPELVEQLGVARFGARPVIGDPFCGGGSIPFESARMGCDVVASDLNPIACMLTWGARNIIGSKETVRSSIIDEQHRVNRAVAHQIDNLGIERNVRGDRAKAFLYCLEVIDPQTGWRVPLAPSWVVSTDRRCVARLEPDYSRKRFNVIIAEGVSAAEFRRAKIGTFQDGNLVYTLSPTIEGEEREWRIPIARLRGDGEATEPHMVRRGNRLRPWASDEIAPVEPTWVPDAPAVTPGSPPGAWRGGDIWLERLYAIQWMDGKDLGEGKPRPRTYFATPDDADAERERVVLQMVAKSLVGWQQVGFVPDMPIEPGEKTDEPIRTRGWTHWHHLFSPRQILTLALTAQEIRPCGRNPRYAYLRDSGAVKSQIHSESVLGADDADANDGRRLDRGAGYFPRRALEARRQGA